MTRFPVFDSLRGLCALALIVHHSHIERSLTELALFKQASYFVELFFAISGFLLYRQYINHLNTPRQLRDFAITQTFRVYPLHVLTLLVFIGFECAKLVLERTGLTLGGPAFSGDRAPAEILPNLLLIQAWWPGFNALSFSYPSWFVSVLYYVALLFGLMVFAVPGLSRIIVALLAVLGCAALFTHSTLLTPNVQWGVAAFFGGAMTYRLYVRLHSFKPGRALSSVLELALLVLTYRVLTGSEEQRPLKLVLLLCGAVLVFAFQAGIISQLLQGSLLRGIGRLWFSIYMIHAAVIFVMGTALQIIARQSGMTLFADMPAQTAGTVVRYISTGSVINDNLMLLFLVLSVLVLAMLVHRFVEVPGIMLGKRWIAGRIIDQRQGPSTSGSV
ncbi:acyltransferase family protein [Pseudomonas huanghezhanensis]|uniref:acyltransferase family protein n=1 Tax=Pseudomonas huanghezhanensis TaxID=3002903 RepID=UPI002285D716|nr:acyltransferase [Pseudomonas sp. BSw22131]